MQQMEDALSYSGKTIKEIRVRKGIKLEDVSESTRVSKRHLRNIEEENFSDLPARIYFKGFLGSYARCLGMNEDEVLRQMLERFEQWENKLTSIVSTSKESLVFGTCICHFSPAWIYHQCAVTPWIGACHRDRGGRCHCGGGGGTGESPEGNEFP